MTNEEKIQLIGQKIYLLSQNMEKYKAELESLQSQLNQLKMEMNLGTVNEKKITPVVPPQQKTVIPPVVTPVEPPVVPPQVQQNVVPPVQQVITPPNYQQQQYFQKQAQQKTAQPKANNNIEGYLGGKVISIVGISLLVLGLAFGVKYSIDNGYLGPLGRIVLGFVAGGILLGLAFFLRKKYKLFSSIILGGSISLMFFTAFAGFSFYNLYPREFAFTVMVLLTAFTVFAAHIYDFEVLAVIALVGAYAIPPLLRDDAGKVHIMFSYMAILNGGILFLSFKKNWNVVIYFAYFLTWIIFGSWMLMSYDEERYFATAFTFLNIFFLTFYTMFMAYKVVRKELFSVFDVLRIMSNSMVYFGIGYFLLNTQANEDYLGLFCIANALVHLVVAAICHRNKNADRKVMFLILTLVFTFITIAVPVQLEGNWVTMVWFSEMAILWIMAKRFDIPLYKHMAFALSILGTGSLLHDWGKFYYLGREEYGGQIAEMFANKYFLTTLFSIGTLGIVSWLLTKEKKEIQITPKNSFITTYGVFFSILLGAIAYFGVVNEIHLHCQNLYNSSGPSTKDEYGFIHYSDRNEAYKYYESYWVIIYTAVYVMALNALNMFFFKNKSLRLTSWILNLFSLLLCITVGLFMVGELKDEYYSSIEHNKEISGMAHYARYLFLPFVILLLVNLSTFKKQEGLSWSKPINLWIGHFITVVLLSNELTYQITEANYENYFKMLSVSFRAGYTILWSVYAMGLFSVGFARKRKMLRLIAMTLVGITLLKLAVQAFSMSRGYQLVTFSAIGIILISVGFLYQKYKHVLLEPDAEEEKIEN